MINNSVTQQLENVKVGLDGLDFSLFEMGDVKSEYEKIENSISTIDDFDKKLAEIHDANNKFLQLNTAMKNINLIVNIKEKVAKAEKHLNEENFLLVSYIIKKNILFS